MKTEITEYSPTAAALAELRQKYEAAVFDTTTTAGMAKAIAARRELREVRVNLEKLRKELKAPALERSRLIDAEAKTLTAKIEAMEEPIDAQIKAEEARKAEEKAAKERAEQERIEAIRSHIRAIQDQAIQASNCCSAEISVAIDYLEDADLLPEVYQEYLPQAEAAREETLTRLRAMLTAAERREDEAERLRIERLALEAERKAQAEQAERERAELAKLRAEQEERDRAARAEIEKQKEAERQRVRAEFEANQKIIDEQERLRKKAEYAATVKREAEEAELARQRAEIEEQRRQVEEATRKVQSGYEALEDFVARFGAEKEFAPIAKTIQKWLEVKKESAA